MLELSKEIFNTSETEFIKHDGNSKFSTYLAMNIPFEPVAKLKDQLEQLTGLPLKSRNEAHITVVTPVEYHRISAFLNIDKINEIALSSNIQAAIFSVEGIGKGTKGSNHVFFILVKSNDLLLIRKKILEKTDQDTRIFDPQHFFPHITIGFTSRDLHEADGVIKDQSSFYTDLKLI